MNSLQLGKQGEKIALTYLKKNGLKLIKQNYYCRWGEIDLIMQDQDYLVFIEVRHRKNQSFGGALASIDHKKQNKLRQSAEHFLQQRKQHNTPCRFDAICLNGNLKNNNINWIKNAF